MNSWSPARGKSTFGALATALAVTACAAGIEPAPADQAPAHTEASQARSGNEAARPFQAVQSAGVSIRCGTRENDHAVMMWAWSSDSVARLCEATCYYRDTGNGDIGSVTNKTTVAANAEGTLFAVHRDPGRTFEVINPGTASCT